jgi:hypothetical protein
MIITHVTPVQISLSHSKHFKSFESSLIES